MTTEESLENALDQMNINESEVMVSNKTATFDPAWLRGTSAEKLLQKDGEPPQVDYSHPIFKTISKLNGKINSMTMLELTKCLKELKLDPSGKKEVLIKRLKTYQKQLHLKRENLVVKEPTGDNEPKRRFDYVCVIDYEATCTGEPTPNYPHEIIEFPIVLIDVETRQIVDYFQEYVRPVIYPKLSEFCVHLTGITQDKVDNAETFPTVLERVNAWFKTKELGSKYKFAVATDGPWDMENFLNLQCDHSEIDYPYWGKEWIDVRKLFSNWFNVRRCGIKKMLNYIGMDFEGKQHCGLDDAKNISRILLKMVDDGIELKFNERIKNCHRPIERNPHSRQQQQQHQEVNRLSDDDVDME